MKNSPHIVMAALVAFGLSSILMAQDGLSVLPESDASFIRQNLPGVVLERVEAAGALSKVDEWHHCSMIGLKIF